MVANVLIAGGSPDDAVGLRPLLSEVRYSADRLLDPAGLASALDRNRPDVVILANAGEDAGRFLAAAGTAPGGRVPVLAIARPGILPADRIALLEAGADEILTRPLDHRLVAATLRNLRRTAEAGRDLRRQRRTAEEIGLSEPPAQDWEAPVRAALIGSGTRQAALSAALGTRVPVLDEDAAIARAAAGRPSDVYVVEADFGGPGRGLSTISELRSDGVIRGSQILVSAADAGDMASALDLGAGAVLPAGASAGEAAIRIRLLAAAKREEDGLRRALDLGLRASVTDALTGLHNRHYAIRRAERLVTEAAAVGRPLALILADLDHFKRINDSFGHPAGDCVLVEVARRLRANLRAEDLLARIGGEEFLIVLPDTTRAEAGKIAARLCRAVRGEPVATARGEIGVTLSMGIAVAGAPDCARGASRDALIELADGALYSAKSAGRNRYAISAPALPEAEA